MQDPCIVSKLVLGAVIQVIQLTILLLCIQYRDYADNELSVEMKNSIGRDIVDEIKMNLFPECIV